MKSALIVPLFAFALISCARSSSIDTAPNAQGGAGGIDIGSNGPDSAACLAAAEAHSNVGCEYWAVDMDSIEAAAGGCFVAFVANTGKDNARIQVSFLDEVSDLSLHAKIPQGSGTTLEYADYDPGVGLPAGQVAILFLAGIDTTLQLDPGNFHLPVACPVLPMRTTLAQLYGTGIGAAFHIRTDAPVVAYQMLPYGGGSAAVTGASLLIPTSAWDTNYVAVDAWGAPQTSSLNVIASEDDTTLTILPKASIAGGGAIDPTPAGMPFTLKLDRGQILQISQKDELSGSPIEADKPVGVFGGAPCIDMPTAQMACDHAEQSIPPIRAMGSEYVAVPYRRRTSKIEDPPWRLLGAVDGTQLSFDPPVPGAPATLALGDVIEVHNGEVPFVVRSQDADHPFLLMGYMTGGGSLAPFPGIGDPDFVRTVPTEEWLSETVFFTDPTYPETSLVITRHAGDDAPNLDCAGELGNWKAVGKDYEYARLDLVRGDFQPQNGCDNGVHRMTSADPFGLTVWGWGNVETSPVTSYVSYAYPAGENFAPLNTVLIPAGNTPK